ncbi:MAG: 50S ribosomal protein L10 [Patescibacteria group bacterium]
MALTRTQKEDQLKELKEKFGLASSVIFANYIGLKVSQVSDLRKKLKNVGAELKVAKKTLMRIASKDKGLPEIDDTMMFGPVACIFSFEDPLTGPQVAIKFSKDHPQVSFLGGVFEGKILSKKDAVTLARMPSREILLATFAGMLQSPLRSFMSMCNSSLTGFARATGELAKKKQS